MKNLDFFPEKESHFLLEGPTGVLETLTTPAATENVAIICHPHPLHGGTMHNKVVTTLAKTFQELNLKTVRFNFRGVEKSTGSYAEGLGETDDFIAIVHWVQKVCPTALLWFAGFSFGAYVAARGATLITPQQLVTVAPPVSRFDLQGLPAITCPWVVVQGDKDEVVEPEAVYRWVETLNPRPTLIKMPDAGHFFHGKLIELREELKRAVK